MSKSLGFACLALALPALVTACHDSGGTLPSNKTYAVPDALAVGDGAQTSAGAFATTYYAPQPAGTPAAVASLSGSGQIAYGPDGSLYRYVDGTTGCALSKYDFGAVGAAQPVATATGDPHLTGTAAVIGCFAAATDAAGNVYVVVANGRYLGIDVFDSDLTYQYQVGNGPLSGIATTGATPVLPLALDSSGRLFVGEGNAVVIFASGVQGDVRPAGVLSVPGTAVALTFDVAGNLYVGNATAVNAYAPSGSGGYTLATTIALPTATTGSGVQQIVHPNALATDSLQNLFVLVNGANASAGTVLSYAAASAGFGGTSATLTVSGSAGSVAVAPLGATVGGSSAKRKLAPALHPARAGRAS